MNPAAIGFSALVRAFTDPHPLYAALRAHDSIHYDPTSELWLVTAHAPIQAILTDPRFSSDVQFEHAAPARTPETAFVRAAIEKGVIFSDGEAHRRVQRVIHRVLGRVHQGSAEAIDAVVRRLVDALASRDSFDLVADFATPLSLLVVSQLLGVPTDDDAGLRRLAGWSDAHGDAVSGYLRVDLQDIHRLGDAFRAMIAGKREAPADDLMSAFLREADAFADDEEVIINCMMIFGAGRVTTRKILSNGLPLLLPRWSAWARCQRGDPTFTARAAEELLRVVTPTRYLLRCAADDVDLSDAFPGDHQIYEGEKLVLFLEAGNRDPAVFTDPDTFDPDRANTRHLAFGQGPHFCPGARLARLEIQIALDLLLAAFPALSAAPDSAPRWNPNPNLGGYDSFLVCPFHPRQDP